MRFPKSVAAYTSLQNRPTLVVALTAVMSLAPLVACVVYVQTYGVNAIFSDQWEIVPLFPKMLNGNLSFEDLWIQHNEHRFLFPRAIMLALGSVTGWSNIAEMYVVVSCISLSTVALFVVFRSTFDSKHLLLFVPVVFVMLTLRQHGNILWGYQISFALTQTMSILALLNLHVHTRRVSHAGIRNMYSLPLALFCALVAAGSSVQGLLVWIAGTALLLISNPKTGREGLSPAKNRTLALWVGTGILVWIFYFLDYTVYSDSSTLLSHLRDPTGTALYLLGLLGEPFSIRPLLPSVMFGAAFVALAGLLVVYFARSASLPRYSFWVSLLLYSLLTLGFVAAGRSDLGIETAYASRYVTFSVLAWVGIYVLLLGWWNESGTRFPGLLVASGAIFGIAMQLLYIETARTAGSDIEEVRKSTRNTVLNIERATGEEMGEISFSPGAVENRTKILKRLEYNVFSDGEENATR